MDNPIDYSLNLIKPALQIAEKLTKLRLSVARSEDYKFLIRTDLPYFCHKYQHDCPDLDKMCVECDGKYMDLASSSEKTERYKCDPLELDEFIVPVKIKGVIRLFIFGGAIRSDDKQKRKVYEKIKSFNPDINEQELLRDIDEYIPLLSENDIKEAVRTIEAFCPLIAELYESKIDVIELNASHAINDITRDMRFFQEPNDLLSAVTETISKATNSDACSIWEADFEKGTLFNLASYNILQAVRFMIMPLDHSITGETIKDGLPRLIKDLSNTAELEYPSVSNLLIKEGYNRMISVPLEIHNGKIGALNIHRKPSSGIYSNDDIELLRKLSSIVSEAFEKARLLKRIQPIVEIATLFNEENTGSIYDKAAQMAAKAVDADGCSIFFVNDTENTLELAGTTGIEDPTGKRMIYKTNEGLTGWIWTNKKPLRIYDCRDKSELESISPIPVWTNKFREKAPYPTEGQGLHSFIGVPISIQNRVIGVIRAAIKNVTQPVFSKEDQRILESLAEQIGFARERFRLVDQFKDRLIKKVEDVSKISQSFIEVEEPKFIDPKIIAQQVAQSLINRTPHWKWASVRFKHDESNELYFASIEGPDVTDDIRKMRFPLTGNSIGTKVYNSQSDQSLEYSPDINKDQNYKCPSKDAKSSVSALISFGENRYGILTVDSDILDGFTEDDMVFLRLLSAQLAIAIEMSKMIESVRTAEQKTREYMQIVAHQLVAPLFAIRAHTDNLLQGRITPHRARIVLESINAQAKIAARTASNFSFISLILNENIEALRKKIRPILTPLDEVFRGLARDYQPMAWLNDIKIIVREETLPSAYIDSMTFTHAAGNIIDNAVKYSKPYTEIIIWGEKKGNNILINVENEGIRLSESEAKRLAERGYRTREAELRIPTGTGLGLWLAKHVLETHNASLQVVPTNSQGKTRFIMQIPLTRI